MKTVDRACCLSDAIELCSLVAIKPARAFRCGISSYHFGPRYWYLQLSTIHARKRPSLDVRVRRSFARPVSERGPLGWGFVPALAWALRE
jgi:hypothetical protein